MIDSNKLRAMYAASDSPNLGSAAFGVSMEYLCESFYSIDAKDTKKGQKVCAWGPEPMFDDSSFIGFQRKGDNLTCSYNFTNPETNNSTNMTAVATCGYNQGEEFYCPQTRSNSIFNEVFQPGKNYFSTDLNCGLETSFQYCEEVVSELLWANKFMAYLWRTTGDRFAQIADNAECVKNTVTAAYWHINDFAAIPAFAAVTAVAAFFSF